MRYTRRMGALFFLIGVFHISTAVWSQGLTSNQNTWSPIAVQLDTAGSVSDISSLIGLTLEQLFHQFGIPESVYSIRGIEAWQDDVVFVYKEGDFYVYKNRVWQIAVKTAYGIKIGDNAALASQLLGEGIQQFDDYLLFSLPGRSWPLMLRINFDNLRSVSAIFIYRPDF